MINDYGYDGNIIAWYLNFFSNRYTRVKYNGKKTKWRSALRNLPQSQTDSTILFVIFMNNVDLLNVRDLLKDLKLKTKSKSEKMKSIEKFGKSNKNSENEYGSLVEFKSNGNSKKEENNDNDDLIFDINKPKFVEIDRFRIDSMNFADDCCLAMKPMIKKCKLTNIIKYNYRLNLQSSITNFFYWTRFYQLVSANSKCSSVTFTRKKFFHAYVCKLDGQKLELVHSNINGPQKCKHNEKYNMLIHWMNYQKGMAILIWKI